MCLTSSSPFPRLLSNSQPLHQPDRLDPRPSLGKKKSCSLASISSHVLEQSGPARITNKSQLKSSPEASPISLSCPVIARPCYCCLLRGDPTRHSGSAPHNLFSRSFAHCRLLGRQGGKGRNCRDRCALIPFQDMGPRPLFIHGSFAQNCASVSILRIHLPVATWSMMDHNLVTSRSPQV